MITELTEAILPPAIRTVGDLEVAKSVLEEFDIRYPDSYWELLRAYGSGGFYDYPLRLFDASSPGFAYRYGLAQGFRTTSATDHNLSHGEWLPVAEDNEYVLFVEPGRSSDSRVLFMCVGSEDEYRVFEVGLAQFILDYPSEGTQVDLYGEFVESSLVFRPSREEDVPSEWLLRAANISPRSDLLELDKRLKQSQ